VEAGFRPATHQIIVLTAPPTPEQEFRVRSECTRLQREMYGMKAPKAFAGTWRALVGDYQTDRHSPYRKMRHRTRQHTDAFLKRIDAKIGTKKLGEMGARDFLDLYEDFRFQRDKNGKLTGRETLSVAHAAITAVRMVLGYGTVFEVDHCAKLRGVLSTLKFENKKARSEAMTLRQCEDIIAAAHRLGFPSIALAQALQFDLRARQGDIIGQWVPAASEPGISRIAHHHGHKWLRGIVWEEISASLMLQHPISKSRSGKVLERDLNLYPMVMAELDRIPAEKRAGPIVVCEITGRPWRSNHFRLKWRDCATAAGLPKTVWNMDSRAGGITETVEVTGDLERARKEAEHSRPETTARYSRRKADANRKTAAEVLEFRAKNKA